MLVTSRIMRTTIDIDDPVLKDLKRLQAKEGKSMGRLVSDLLATALAGVREEQPQYEVFEWFSADMDAIVDIADRDAILDAMDSSSVTDSSANTGHQSRDAK